MMNLHVFFSNFFVSNVSNTCFSEQCFIGLKPKDKDVCVSFISVYINVKLLLQVMKK